MSSNRGLALAGVVTGAAGLATSQATVWALRAPDGPVTAVAAAVRDLTPGHLAVRLVHLVQHADKPLLVAGTTVAVLAICAAAGVATRRHPLVPDLVHLALAAAGFAALLRLPHTGFAGIASVVVGLVTWLVVHRVLTAPLLIEPSTPGESRRAVLLRSAGVVAAAALAALGGQVASRGRRRVEEARRLLRLPVTGGTVPAGADANVPGVVPWQTPSDRFYLVDTAFAPPSIEPGDWSLRVHGMVERELTISYDDLVSRPFTEAWVTLACVSNEVGGDLVGNAWWSGVRISDVLAGARPHQDADAVLQKSHDGWTCGTPLAALTDGRNALLAVAMNGQPLPVEHGFPVRMVVPGLYGYVSATKWVVDLEVTRFDRFEAYWTRRGWSEQGPVKTQSRIDVPRDGQSVKAGSVRIGGCAWAQHRGIERVEYQLDGGPWVASRLGRVPSVDTWVQWTGVVDVDRGDHRLVVRATDRAGHTQTSVRHDVVPDGATGWHTVAFGAH